MSAPHKRKESNLTIPETMFMKHVYGRDRKHVLKPLEDFDPRPAEFRGNAKEYLYTFLDEVRGRGLGVALLLDKEC